MHGSLIELIFFGIATFINTLVEASSHPLEDDQRTLVGASPSPALLNLLIAVSSFAFLTVAVTVIIKCADCYNSEVSTENHPACGVEKQYKWGGAVGYTSANSSDPNAGYRSGERVEFNQQQSLPYTMIPTSVPASGGFQGYSPIGQGQAGDGQPLPGSFGHQDSVRSNSSYGGARNYNPMETQEPPPAYEEAAGRSGSFYGNR